MSTAIRFDCVSKKFNLHRERARSFQELVLHLFRRSNSSGEEFWALRNVNFTVEQGEMVGLIGPNGAGKSTALKLISRIIEPTSGQIEVNGRVGALLELGAGFHPDLTGRENIYLNGSILGLSRAQIRQKLDEIIAFAELERFIDVPVKHYSSGMYVRLGFSVAVHTDPEILLVDEVLAVGDAAFHRKCLDRINGIKDQGVTIVFVSHNLNTVRDLCTRGIWLREGCVAGIGPVEKVIDGYLNAVTAEQAVALQQHKIQESARRWGNGEVEITGVRFLDIAGKERFIFKTGEPMITRISFRSRHRVERPVFGIAIYRNDGMHINGPNTRFADYEIDAIEGEGVIDYCIKSLPLLRGTYEFSATVYDCACQQPYDHHHRMYSFMVEQGDIVERYGCVYVPSRWRLLK